jgi:hypothetical protein
VWLVDSSQREYVPDTAFRELGGDSAWECGWAENGLCEETATPYMLVSGAA